MGHQRHPGHADMTLSALGSALLRGSAGALLPWAGHVALVLVRTGLEGRMLTAATAGGTSATDGGSGAGS
jgi:hypothetical protein